MDARNNPECDRFVARTAHGVARLDYDRLDERTLVFKHTFVPEADRSQGIAGSLVERAFRHAADRNLKVIPTCPFVRSWLNSNPRYLEVARDG